MNNQALLDHPELTLEYLAGVRARAEGHSKLACPYQTADLYASCLWHAGWGDTDIWMTAEPIAA